MAKITKEQQLASKQVLLGFRDALTAAVSGDFDGAVDTFNDLLDDDTVESTLDGLETIAQLLVKASEDDSEDDEDDSDDYDDEDDSEDDEDNSDEDDSDEDEDDTKVESRVKTRKKSVASVKSSKAKRTTAYLDLALASLDDIEDEDDEDTSDEDVSDDDSDEDEDDTKVESRVKRKKAVASVSQKAKKLL